MNIVRLMFKKEYELMAKNHREDIEFFKSQIRELKNKINGYKSTILSLEERLNEKQKSESDMIEQIQKRYEEAREDYLDEISDNVLEIKSLDYIINLIKE